MTPRLDRPETKSRAALIEAYREGLGLAAIAVIRGTAGMVRIEALANCTDGTLAPDATVEALWWCRRSADAARLAKAAQTRIERREAKDCAAAADTIGRIAANVVEAAAQQCSVALHSDDEITAAALMAIARVDSELAKLKEAGQLKSVNRSYRTYREDASARGERVLPYVRWLDKYKEKLVRELAAALRYC